MMNVSRQPQSDRSRQKEERKSSHSDGEVQNIKKGYLVLPEFNKPFVFCCYRTVEEAEKVTQLQHRKAPEICLFSLEGVNYA